MTGEFKLDTTGEVYVDEGPHRGQRFMWRNLSPFAQGYVEAMFAETIHGDPRTRWGRHYRFSDLAPSTLAAILKDCEAFRLSNPGYGDDGALFWRNRNLQGFFGLRFPPLTVSLNDAGQVVIGGDQGASVASRSGSPASPVKSDSAEGH